MKNVFKSAAIAAALLASIGAAQAVDKTYKSADGGWFSLHNVYRIDPAINGFVRVVYINGGDTLHADSNNSVFNTIKADNPQMITISGTQSLLDPTYAARGVCQSGWSRVPLQGSSVIIEVLDSCAMVNEAKSKAK